MQSSVSSYHEDSKMDSEENGGDFEKSLQELRDLRSQLRYAADHCESTFSNSEHKKLVIENAKDYICRAVVTVVDHLGSVSSTLNQHISRTNSFSQVDLRITCLQQRIGSCSQYAHSIALNQLRWREILPTYHPRYLSTQAKDVEISNKVSRESNDPASARSSEKLKLYIEEDMPVFLYTTTHKPSATKNLSFGTPAYKGDTAEALVLPVFHGLSVISRAPNSNFNFQVTKKPGRHRRSIPGSDILSLLWRTKRSSTREIAGQSKHSDVV